MPHYSWFHGLGHAILADVLGAEDPFSLSAGAMVDRIVAAGYAPAINEPRDEPFRTFGRVTEIAHEGITYIVAACRHAEEISVQERRAEAYGVIV